jgi:hypothetical protein
VKCDLVRSHRVPYFSREGKKGGKSLRRSYGGRALTLRSSRFRPFPKSELLENVTGGPLVDSN